MPRPCCRSCGGASGPCPPAWISSSGPRRRRNPEPASESITGRSTWKTWAASTRPCWNWSRASPPSRCADCGARSSKSSCRRPGREITARYPLVPRGRRMTRTRNRKKEEEAEDEDESPKRGKKPPSSGSKEINPASSICVSAWAARPPAPTTRHIALSASWFRKPSGRRWPSGRRQTTRSRAKSSSSKSSIRLAAAGIFWSSPAVSSGNTSTKPSGSATKRPQPPSVKQRQPSRRKTVKRHWREAESTASGSSTCPIPTTNCCAICPAARPRESRRAFHSGGPRPLPPPCRRALPLRRR